MKRIIQVFGVIIMLAAIAYFGTCAYAIFFDKSAKNKTDQGIVVPDISKAAYVLTIRDTGNVVMTNKYDSFGDVVGKRTYILHGYWELVGEKFVFRPGDIILREQIFGEITSKRRTQ